MEEWGGKGGGRKGGGIKMGYRDFYMRRKCGRGGGGGSFV